ncbi:YfiT family bacillithiol transferase [Paenibacillus mendelii]|uniref:Putative metal-dependent hydrolase ACFFJ8_09035 n=1 Tax=Paenibacillus mendelii TaxID=206163 RepID=A0ABV6J6M1_9BACL|nr:bacillithiol transferase BstA [Paenibacillus mendelii]MCQ6561108.1 bacillithiol transferase BstA [Paenibacillus mendelii]
MGSGDASYPIGPFKHEGIITEEQRAVWIREIESLPLKLAMAVEDLSDSQLDTPYREGGWTIRQVVHHLADSHMNSMIRFKLALTEENPTVKPYAEDRWAMLEDSRQLPILPSLLLLESLHLRWTCLLRSLRAEDYERTFYHPESKQSNRLAHALGVYAWHGNHHVAHIRSLRERMGW